MTSPLSETPSTAPARPSRLRIAATVAMALVIIGTSLEKPRKRLGTSRHDEALAGWAHLNYALEPRTSGYFRADKQLQEVLRRYGELAESRNNSGEIARQARISQAALAVVMGEKDKAAEYLEKLEPSYRGPRVGLVTQGLRRRVSPWDPGWQGLLYPRANVRWLSLVQAAAEQSGRADLAARAAERQRRKARALLPAARTRRLLDRTSMAVGAGVLIVLVLARGRRRCPWLGPRPAYSVHDALDLILLWVLCKFPVGRGTATLFAPHGLTDAELAVVLLIRHVGGLALAILVAKYTFLVGKRVRALQLGWWGSLRPGELVKGVFAYCALVPCAWGGYLLDKALMTAWQRPVAGGPSSHAPFGLVVYILFSVCVAPVAEELLFRGLFFAVLRRRLGLLRSAVLTGLLFSVYHQDPGQLFDTWLAGTALSVVRERYGSILPCIVAHACWNLVAELYRLSLMAVATA